MKPLRETLGVFRFCESLTSTAPKFIINKLPATKPEEPGNRMATKNS